MGETTDILTAAKNILGLNKEPEKKTAPSVSILKDIKDLPKSYRRKENRQYQITKYGKTYVFFNGGKGGIIGKDRTKVSTVNSEILVSQIKQLDTNQKATQQDLKTLKSTVNTNRKETVVNKGKETVVNKGKTKEIVSNDGLLAGLKSLIGGPQSKIDSHIDRNRDQYTTFVNSSSFQVRFNRAITNPQQNALIIQLYAQFALKDNSIVINGRYNSQVMAIVDRYLGEKTDAERQKRREERKNMNEPDIITKGQEITYKTSQIISESIDKQDNHNYARLFHLPDETIESLIKPRERKNKTPEQIQQLKEKRQSILFERTKKSAISGCINYLQELFTQKIPVEGNLEEDLGKMFENLDMTNGVQSHGQSLDFKVILRGRPFSICYNISNGELQYTPLFVMKKSTGDIFMEKEGLEDALIENPKKMPSLTSMLENAKSAIVSQARSKPGSWGVIRDTIKTIERPRENIIENQERVAKIVAKEDCMQSFLELTGYKLTQNLPKQSYQNSQIYMVYDIINRTFNNPTMKASDIYRLKKRLELLKEPISMYKSPSNNIPKNMRNKQFSITNLRQQQSDITGPKIDANQDNSLAFYNLFNQYISNKKDSSKSDYFTLDINKIDADLKYYATNGCLQDKGLVAGIEKEEKNNADIDLSKKLTQSA